MVLVMVEAMVVL
jgi:hypothetical protein